MRTLLISALFLSTSSFACDKQGAPPPGQGAGSSAGAVENPPPVEAGTATATAGPDGPGNLVACGAKTCGAGEECISYYGIAGPRGPEFHECGIRCTKGAPNDGCADGKHCTTIADGPGPVCR
jgi:hypothetical protein